MNKLIEIKQLNTSYKTDKLLENVNLSIYEYDRLYLKGKNASGKSTFLKTLIGKKSFEGNIIFEKKDLKIIYIRDTLPLILEWNGYQNIICEDKDFHRKPINYLIAEIDQWLNLFPYKIDLNLQVSQLTLIEKCLIVIIKAMYFKTNLFLFDETFSELKKEDKVKVYKIIKELNLTTIYVTHQEDEISTYFTRFLKIEDCQIKEFYSNNNLSKERQLIDSKKDIDLNSYVKSLVNNNKAFIIFDFNTLDEFILEANLLENYKTQLFNLNIFDKDIFLEDKLIELLSRYNISYTNIHQKFETLSFGNQKKFKFMISTLIKKMEIIYLNLFENLDQETIAHYKILLANNENEVKNVIINNNSFNSIGENII